MSVVVMAFTGLLIVLSLFQASTTATAFSFSSYNRSAFQIPSLGFNSVLAAAAADECTNNLESNPSLKLHLKHRPLHHPNSSKRDSLHFATRKDLTRIHTLAARTKAKLNQSTSPAPHQSPIGVGAGAGAGSSLSLKVESGVSLGSGEYFIDVLIGNPPVNTSLILDTGSDLIWLQCLPCLDCFPQHPPIFDPSASSSYRNISCSDPRCSLVSSPSPSSSSSSSSCSKQPHLPCPYFYWYGDRSNTTGDLALETLTLNLTTNASPTILDVIFGCGHWNRGLFHGAAGLLGLGRGPLSFASQLSSLYGHTFSYCLVDRNSDLSVTSKLVFGDHQLSNLVTHNYTRFLSGKDNPADTFYYVHIASVRVGGELVPIPIEMSKVGEDGSGGTIIDSGTTLTYFADPAYQLIRQAFVKKIKYPLVDDFPVLNPCYNVSGLEEVEMPGFSIVFGDGAVWDFPVENYFIRLEPDGIMCLAILGTKTSSLSIIGNYQQQNFHVLYDIKRSRLGFAPTRCAQV